MYVKISIEKIALSQYQQKLPTYENMYLIIHLYALIYPLIRHL